MNKYTFFYFAPQGRYPSVEEEKQRDSIYSLNQKKSITGNIVTIFLLHVL